MSLDAHEPDDAACLSALGEVLERVAREVAPAIHRAESRLQCYLSWYADQYAAASDVISRQLYCHRALQEVIIYLRDSGCDAEWLSPLQDILAAFDELNRGESPQLFQVERTGNELSRHDAVNLARAIRWLRGLSRGQKNLDAKRLAARLGIKTTQLVVFEKNVRNNRVSSPIVQVIYWSPGELFRYPSLDALLGILEPLSQGYRERANKKDTSRR